MSMKVLCETDNGGCVEFNREVTVSSNVAGVEGQPKETTHIFLRKQDKRVKATVQVFFNSMTGLLVVDAIDPNEKGGTEVFRQQVL